MAPAQPQWIVSATVSGRQLLTSPVILSAHAKDLPRLDAAARGRFFGCGLRMTEEMGRCQPDTVTLTICSE